MNITIIGMGLIGGSMAMGLRNCGIAKKIIAVDNNKEHGRIALELGLADAVMSLEEGVREAAVIILAVPVNAAEKILPGILNNIETQLVFDAGSTKEAVCRIAEKHPKGGRFVATHPMWGTEFSGPTAAMPDAFKGKAVVICNKENSDADALKLTEEIYSNLGMHSIYMDAEAHDLHAAYISHVSHITSFALANTVLEKEKDDDKIFEMASGGFESTVRLAKSNAAMWVPIFMQNKENVLDVLNEHISQLRKFKSCLEKDNYEYLEELIVHANKIKRILK